MRNIVGGIKHLHDSKQCHLDIKSNNVSDLDSAVITDFIFATLGENFTIILITKHAGVADNLKQVRKQIQKHQSMALNSVIGVSMF